MSCSTYVMYNKSLLVQTTMLVAGPKPKLHAKQTLFGGAKVISSSNTFNILKTVLAHKRFLNLFSACHHFFLSWRVDMRITLTVSASAGLSNVRHLSTIDQYSYNWQSVKWSIDTRGGGPCHCDYGQRVSSRLVLRH